MTSCGDNLTRLGIFVCWNLTVETSRFNFSRDFVLIVREDNLTRLGVFISSNLTVETSLFQF